MRAREMLRSLTGDQRHVLPWLAVGLSLTASACQTQQSSDRTNYYDRKIGPALVQACATSPTKSGCHVAADDHGDSLGNLNVTSYDSLTKRKDLFLRYGPYGLPALLLKVAPDYPIALTTWQNDTPTLITTHISHVGGTLLDLTSPSFTLLDTWISNGFAVNNAPAADPTFAQTPCSNNLGTDPDFDSTQNPTTPDYQSFSDNVNPVIGSRCAAGNCHGSPANSLYLTCGTTAEARRWNYFAVGDYVSTDTGTSEILRRALSPSVGGVYHEGGTIFATSSDPGYEALVAWATLKGGPTDKVVPGQDDGLLFFANRVQPMLVKRGCMMVNCHSGSMFHDYRLRGGSGGHFGLPATRKNYAFTLEQLALDSPDFNASRIVRKNLPPFPQYGGMLHRGGALFGDKYSCTDAELAAAADMTVDIDTQAPYCVIKAWFQKEQAARVPTPGLTGIVFVRRPPAPLPDRPQDYASYAPGAQVIEVGAALDATNAVNVSTGAETNLTTLCGLSGTNTDARRPTVSWDAKQIAFSARQSAADPFHVYVYNATTGACAVQPDIDKPAVADDGSAVPDNGELVHNFDPAFAPDGRIVFASTRGNIMNTAAFSYSGPQRTPADPTRLNSNLYVLEGTRVRQLTFLLNQELSPAFMRDGRLIMVTEKRAPGFYQLAGRRMNLDGGDYHPLFGQRDTIGFDQLTDVVELTDKNFAAILSDHDAAHGAGALAIFNRSVGIDQRSEDLKDYVAQTSVTGTGPNPPQISVIDWPKTPFFQHSLSILDDKATGKVAGTQGAYRSPSLLPTQHLLVSYAANVVALDNFAGNFDIVEVDPNTGTNVPLITGPQDELWPVAVAPRYNLRLFQSRLDEPNGATQIVNDDEHKDHAEITFLDAPLISSLLFQNTRTGRVVPQDNFGLSLWEEFPPESGVKSFDGANQSLVFSDDFGKVYVRRGLLGAPPVYGDGSTSVAIRGGMPLVLRARVTLASDSAPTDHFQREEMQFYPGEVVRQGFRRKFFNGLCAGCHGSITGYETDISPNPDILTQASSVEAKVHSITDLRLAPTGTSGPVAP
jgi:WD40-like Beta Propeller Repeat